MSKKPSGGSGGKPFFMVKPDPSTGGTPMIEAVAGKMGEYNITLLLGKTNSNSGNRNSVVLVSFINGKQKPGVIKVNANEQEHTFSSIKPDKNGQIEISVASVSMPDPDLGVTITLTKRELIAVAPMAPAQIERIKVTKTSKAADGYYGIHIQLFDVSGTAMVGKAIIQATQEFKVGNKKYKGFFEIDIADTNGVRLRVKALSWQEEFQFIDDTSGQIKKLLLLKG